MISVESGNIEIDLPSHAPSGLLEAKKVLKKVGGFASSVLSKSMW